MTMPGPLELILIAGVIVLLFGAKKIPDLAKGLGLGIKEFKKASKEGQEEVENAPEKPDKGEEKTS